MLSMHGMRRSAVADQLIVRKKNKPVKNRPVQRLSNKDIWR
jgi:hypothetical protein